MHVPEMETQSPRDYTNPLVSKGLERLSFFYSSDSNPSLKLCTKDLSDTILNYKLLASHECHICSHKYSVPILNPAAVPETFPCVCLSWNNQKRLWWWLYRKQYLLLNEAICKSKCHALEHPARGSLKNTRFILLAFMLLYSFDIQGVSKCEPALILEILTHPTKNDKCLLNGLS